MATKCVHKGCGKIFTDPAEPCVYHPGAPEFHEGQKGWKCCKPRVLTFDEFLAIPPCTTGTHSAVDDAAPTTTKPAVSNTPETKLEQKKVADTASSISAAMSAASLSAAVPTTPVAAAPEPESETDDDDLPIPSNATCRRRGCNETYKAQTRECESCVYHPGTAIFHEGSKGWSCCKRRVLEFDEFMRIAGCKTRKRHCFVGKKKDANAEELVQIVRSDFYQTTSNVIVSIFLKKIDAKAAAVEYVNENTLKLDLPTADQKRYRETISLFGPVDTEKSSHKVMGTKLELSLVKADGRSWPVLRSTDKTTGEIIQVGGPGKI